MRIYSSKKEIQALAKNVVKMWRQNKKLPPLMVEAIRSFLPKTYKGLIIEFYNTLIEEDADKELLDLFMEFSSENGVRVVFRDTNGNE